MVMSGVHTRGCSGVPPRGRLSSSQRDAARRLTSSSWTAQSESDADDAADDDSVVGGRALIAESELRTRWCGKRRLLTPEASIKRSAVNFRCGPAN
jgi:hypothetical protein